MKINKSTKSLFWQNIIANILMISGGILILVSLFLIISNKFLIGFSLIVAGSIFIIKGKMRRLDYERKSGYIIYGK